MLATGCSEDRGSSREVTAVTVVSRGRLLDTVVGSRQGAVDIELNRLAGVHPHQIRNVAVLFSYRFGDDADDLRLAEQPEWKDQRLRGRCGDRSYPRCLA